MQSWKHQEQKRWYKPSIPSVNTGDVKSLPNKMKELTVLTRLQYGECCMVFLTETWLNEFTVDSLDGGC